MTKRVKSLGSSWCRKVNPHTRLTKYSRQCGFKGVCLYVSSYENMVSASSDDVTDVDNINETSCTYLTYLIYYWKFTLNNYFSSSSYETDLYKTNSENTFFPTKSKNTT